MTTAFKELAGSPREVFGPEGMQAQRQLVVAWEDRHALVAQLLGDGYQFGVDAPAAYPQRSAVVAMRVAVAPWPPAPDAQGTFNDVTAQLNSYSGKFAQLTVDYELLDTALGRGDLPDPVEGTYLTYRMDFGGEYLRVSGQSLSWQSDATLPVPPEAVPTLRVPIIEHHITWHRVVSPPWAAIRAATGAINVAAFLGAAPETLLFDGAAAVKQFLGVDALQQPKWGWRITYVFRERAILWAGTTCGWNHRYRALPPGSPGWDRLVDISGHGLYRTTDFSALFQFAS